MVSGCSATNANHVPYWGGCPDFKSPKSLLPTQNHWAYFLSPSQDMLIPTPCTPSDLLCQHERWGQHGRGLTEKWGYLLRRQAIATVYSCFPIYKMVRTSATSLLQRDIWQASLTAHIGWSHAGTACSCSLGLQGEASASPSVPSRPLPSSSEKQPRSGWTAPPFSGPPPTPQQGNSFAFLPQVPSLERKPSSEVT